MLHVTVRQLSMFAAVARHLSFVRTAEELHLTAPAVSMQIKQLENQIGLPLFERNATAVRLTVAGEYLLVHARRILSSLKEAEDLVARLRRVEAGRITLGMLGTAKYFLPHLLAEFLKDHPAVEVNLLEGNREQLVGHVQNNEVDLAVMGRPPQELDTTAEVFGEHPIGIVAAPTHPLARNVDVSAERLADMPFIIRESGSGSRSVMEAFFREKRLRPPILMQMGNNETIKQAVMADMGLAFLSLHTCGIELEQNRLKLLHVDGLPVIRHWHVVHRKARTLSPPAEALRYFLLERGRPFLRTYFSELVPRSTGRGAKPKRRTGR